MEAMKYARDNTGVMYIGHSVGRDLTCMIVETDGTVKTSCVHLPQIVGTFDLCLSKSQECCVLIGTNSSCSYVFVEDGKLSSDRLVSLAHNVSRWVVIKGVSSLNRYIMCSPDVMHSLEAIEDTGASLAFRKDKVNVNSEIGPQTRLLVSKDKSTISSICDVQQTGSDVVIVTSNPTTCLCTVHYATTTDLPGDSIQLKWSMALPTDRVLVATNCSAAAAHPKGFAWTCIVVGTQLRVATPSAVLVPIELHCNPTAAVIVRSELFTDLVAEYAVTYTATVVLSLPGDRYFECVLRVSDGACSATSIRETFFQVPCERPSVSPVSTKEPALRRTRTELPWCETLVSMDVSWLRGMTGLVAQPLPLVLVGYHSQHGTQLIVEDTAEALLTAEQMLRLANFARAVRTVTYQISQSRPLETRCKRPVDTRRVLTSSFCPVAKHSTLRKLALQTVRVETQSRIDLDESSFFPDAQVHVTSSPRADTSAGSGVGGPLVMLTSRRASQTALFRLNLPQLDLEPFGSEYSGEESSLALLECGECAVQVTPSALYLLNGGTGPKKCFRWDAQLREAISSRVKMDVVTVMGESRQTSLSADVAQGFLAQFVVRAGSQLVIASNDLLVVVGTHTASGALSVRIMQILQLHAVVCGLASSHEDATNSLVCVSFWPQGQPVAATTASQVQLFHALSGGDLVFACQLRTVSVEGEAWRHLAVLTLPSATNRKIHAVLCGGASGDVAIHHVERNPSTGDYDQRPAQAYHVEGGVESAIALSDSRCFLLRSRSCEYVLRSARSGIDIAWSCNEISTLPGARRCSVATWSECAEWTDLSSAPTSSRIAWIDVLHSIGDGAVRPMLCFGEIRTNTTCAQPEHRRDIPGKVVSLGVSPCKRRMLIMNCDADSAEERVARRSVVCQGELSLVDTASFKSVWRQKVFSGSTKLLGAVMGPALMSVSVSLSENKPIITVLSLIEARLTSSQYPIGVLSEVGVTAIELKEEPNGTVRATPVGHVTVAADPSRLHETPPAPEVSTTTGTTVPPPEPRLEGFVNNALYFECVADCVVLCLPGNVLSLVGWESAEGGALRLSEHQRLDLQDKNAAVLEMVVAGDCYVILALALIGVEIYAVRSARCGEKPTLQFVHAVAGAGAVWSELYVRDFSRSEAEDERLVLALTDRVTEAKHCITVFLPSAANLLKNASIQSAIYNDDGTATLC